MHGVLSYLQGPHAHFLSFFLCSENDVGPLRRFLQAASRQPFPYFRRLSPVLTGQRTEMAPQSSSGSTAAPA